MAVGEEEHRKSSDDGNQLQELEEKSSNDQTEEKGSRIRARKYQSEICKKAVDENIIVCLGTGCGKTHIAVLLIYELRHLIRRPQKSVCVFLAPTVPLVRQQASVIEETSFKVGSYFGNCKHTTNHQEWEKKIEEYEVLVMTPHILLHNLLHRLIKMELIALLIFDECHHAQSQSNHPYAQIMKEYKTNATKRPRIFGMTTSPIIGKGGANPDDLPRGINSLENLLEAKVYSVEDTEELERFVASPKLKFYYYGPVGDCSVLNSYLKKLEEIKNQVYIRDESFDPSQFYALGRPCAVDCNQEIKMSIHFQHRSGSGENESNFGNVKCRMGHHWLHRKTIPDVVEALVGAFIVDSGFKAAIAFLKWIGIQVDYEASQVSKLCLASKSYMSLSNYIDSVALEKPLGYRFMHKGLLVQAYVHPSYNKHLGGCYQRLEFLGDAVLDYLITSYLFTVYQKLKPGQLIDLRSVTVNNNVFARVAVGRSFHKYLISDSSSLSEAVQNFVSSSKLSPVRQGVTEGPKCPKALGDLVESCVGAILLDSGFNLNLVWEIVLSFLDPIMSFSSFQLNPFRELTELCQSRSWDMQFSSSKKGGTLVVDASVTGSDVHATGYGTNTSRKAAMRTAAHKIFLKLKAQGYTPNKSKSLEKFLKSSRKEDAKLIGYDEIPTRGDSHDVIQLENLQLQKGSPACPDHIANTQTVNKELADIPRLRHPVSTVEAQAKHHCEIIEDAISVIPSNIEDILPMSSAKSRLFEICSANYWKAPTFECMKEEGPSHLKLFTYKVIVEIVGTPNTILECFSEPRPKKKDAEERAAEGALWYLQPMKITSSELLMKSQAKVKLNCNDETPISSGKQEVNLIHGDENPTLGYSKEEENIASHNGGPNVVNKEPADVSSCIIQVETPEMQYHEIRNGAKASLSEKCSGMSWKAPAFELVKEEGEDHLKLFSI